LLARVFMHRVVYYHKTTFGFEEACRQLLRRIRDSRKYDQLLAEDGRKIREIAAGGDLRGFTDDYIDRVIYRAVDDQDPVIQVLASCLVERRPPRLICEVGGIEDKINGGVTAGLYFKQKCRDGLEGIAKRHKLQIGQFLLCGPKPIKFEERGSLFSRVDAEKLKPEEREELIMIFPRGQEEPKSIVDIGGSIIKNLSNQVFSIQRLYLVERDLKPEKLEQIRKEIRDWSILPK
jgi:hypothetical protein